MDNAFKRTSHTAHLIFFDTVEKSGSNRQDLARLALTLANHAARGAIDLSRMLHTLHWDEYQTMLSILSLKAHTPICWDEFELASLTEWADEIS
jgi:hypothetical protein